MPLRLPALLVLVGLALVGAGCEGAPGAATPSRPPTGFPAQSPVPPVQPPAALVLGPAETGLAPSASEDHLGIEVAAEREVNQPLALTEYRRWGWVEASVRTFGPDTLTLLLCSSEDGAALAARGWAAPGTGTAAGHRGLYAARVRGPDADRLLAAQLARLPG